MRIVSRIAAALLEVYDAVLFADADEFLVADPERHEVADLLAKREGTEVFGAQALNVVHDATREGALDPDQPVLGQRQWAKSSPSCASPRSSAPWRRGWPARTA